MPMESLYAENEALAKQLGVDRAVPAKALVDVRMDDEEGQDQAADSGRGGGAGKEKDADESGGGEGGSEGGGGEEQEGGGGGINSDAAGSKDPEGTPGKRARFAYATVVSVEAYVEGALVLAGSLKNQSKLLQSNEAVLVAIASKPGVGAESIERLDSCGWNVVEVDGFATRVPKANWADSFDKLHIFGLTQFERVVFMDADMLALSNPDDLLTEVKLTNSSCVGAIGNKPTHHKGPYFQSGMLVLQPTKKVYRDLINDFKAESLPNPHGRYNKHNGRDGDLLRRYFGGRYTLVSSQYSKHVAPWDPYDKIIMCHFRGSFKPWSNIDATYRKDPSLLSFGPLYHKWWEYYEAFHRRETSGVTGSWGPGGAADPKTHAWVLRETDAAYVRVLPSVDKAQRSVTREGTVLVAAAQGQSCQAACRHAGEGRVCDAALLTATSVNACETLSEAFECPRCRYAEHREEHPAQEAPFRSETDGDCVAASALDPRLKPGCDLRHDDVRRLCPCSPASELQDQPFPWNGTPFTVIDASSSGSGED
ncbi:Glycogenin-1 [Diplonema papillatum]|nr:Glycogenin-1 [Diplonema papillatum]